MQLLINIDVPDLIAAQAFYCSAFGLTTGRRLGGGVIELLNGPAPIYLLEKAAGSRAIPGHAVVRSYERHWCPVHLDWVVDDIVAAMARATAAGAVGERPLQTFNWGKIAQFADPFGHGFCLIEFCGRGYDELVATT